MAAYNVPSNPSINKYGSMAFIADIFQSQEPVETGKRATQQQHQTEMSMAEFRELQKHIVDSKGKILTNATLKIEMAKLLAAKRASVQQMCDDVQQSQPQKKGATKLQGAMGKLFAVSSIRGGRNKPVATVDKLQSAARKSKSSTNEQINLHEGYKSPSPTCRSTKERKPQSTFLSGLANEKLPNHDRVKVKGRKNKHACFIINKFPDMESNESAIASASAMLPPIVTGKNFDCDEGFIDGLAFFTGLDDIAKMKESMEERLSTSPPPPPWAARGA
jgi:hypothetical protein